MNGNLSSCFRYVSYLFCATVLFGVVVANEMYDGTSIKVECYLFLLASRVEVRHALCPLHACGLLRLLRPTMLRPIMLRPIVLRPIVLRPIMLRPIMLLPTMFRPIMLRPTRARFGRRHCQTFGPRVVQWGYLQVTGHAVQWRLWWRTAWHQPLQAPGETWASKGQPGRIASEGSCRCARVPKCRACLTF